MAEDPTTEPTVRLDKAEQIDLLEEIQTLLLRDLVTALKSHKATAPDRATIIRLLQSNGWDLDPARVPQELRDKLTKAVKFDADLEGEAPAQLRIMP